MNKLKNILHVFLLVSLWINSDLVFAYTLPAGVPTPNGWGSVDPINSSRPDLPTAWLQQVNNFYYIDSLHAAATDTANAFGYPDKPRLTIPATLAAGAVVVVVNLTSNTTLSASGSLTNPIWIVGQGASTIQPKQVGTFFSLINSSHVIVDGINFDGDQSPNTAATVAWTIRDGSHHISIRNCNIRNMPAPAYNPTRFQSGGAGAWYAGLTSISPRNASVHDIVVYGCNWTGNAGGQNLDYENGRHCLISAGNTTNSTSVNNVWIVNNIMHDNPEDGIQLGETSINADQSLLKNFYIVGNQITNNGENAVDLKACDQILVYYNVFSGYKPTSYRSGAVSGSDGSACVINDDGKGPLHSWWIFNTISDSRSAWRNQASGGDHYMINNLVTNLHKKVDEDEPTTSGRNGGVAYWQSSGASVHLANNTFYKVHGGIYIANTINASLHSNILYDLFNSTLGWPINITNFSNLDLGNNFYFDPDGALRRDDNALAQSDKVDIDPQIVNPTAGNFKLNPNSGVILNPPALTFYEDAFTQSFGTNISFNFNRTLTSPGAAEIPSNLQPAVPMGFNIH